MEATEARALIALVGRIADRYAPEWQRTAGMLPPVGVRVLMHHKPHDWTVVGRRRGDHEYELAWHPAWDIEPPTHWRYLPLPPVDDD